MAVEISMILEMIERLVGFDTVSAKSNLEFIDFVRGHLAGHGIECHLVYDAARRKANLYATIGATDRGGIMLSGHTDVVPVDGQSWSSDPFRLTRRGERLYGRGAADMKSFLAVVLALVPEFVSSIRAFPMHLAFSFDEEVGCKGVRGLIAEMREWPVRPLAGIIGEPTGMNVAIAHKGKQALRCTVHGQESHSALIHRGVNAVEAAAELVAHLKSHLRRIRAHGPFDARFAPPYTSIHTGRIEGGTALNIVPQRCSFEFEIRPVPADDPAAIIAEAKRYAHDDLLPEMQAVSPGAGFDWQEIAAYSGLDLPADHPLTALGLALTGQNEAGTLSFGTEGGLYQEIGIPVIVCGPGHIENAHGPDEYVELAQIERCADFLRRLAGRPDLAATLAATL